MSFFKAYFGDTSFGKKETAVCCPFPHRTEMGDEYFEINPSAHVNIPKGLFHCKVCGTGESEVGFIARVLGTTYEHAVKLQKLYLTEEDLFDWDTSVTLPDDIKEKITALGITEKVASDLHLGTEEGDEIAVPVVMYDRILDVRSYRPDGPRDKKIKSRVGSTSGLIIPYDLWTQSDLAKCTLICAGEKDMMVARSQGFEAITITGGEMALPKMLNCFKDRKLAICYDNDEAGKKGGMALALHLYKVAKEVKVVTKFHDICVQQGEDLTDFFTKYRRSRMDLIEMIRDTIPFSEEDAAEVLISKYPHVSLIQSSQPQYVNRVVQTNVQVVATYDKALTVPTTITGTKVNMVGGRDMNNTMLVGEEKTWNLTESNVQDILHLMDNNFTETTIKENMRTILKIPKIEHGVVIKKLTKETIYKCNVIDLFEASSDHTDSIEFEAYVLKKKLEAGKKYKITYKIVPHPYKGQQLTMIILDVEESSDSVTNFKLTDQNKFNLSLIKDLPGTVEERVHELTEKVKAFTKYDGYNQLIQAIDFSFNTVLAFNFGSHTDIRGYLDTIVVAESRVGKSSTAESLQKLYGLGTFASLAGGSATVAGLIGGSNKVNGTFQTRAGVIPQNHKGMIIFEELGKSNANIIKELTDIKSSNQVRLARVSGTVELPAMVRMLTLTNPKMVNNQIKSIQSYPNGIEVLTDLIGTAEDIARFDLMLILGETGNQQIDPFWVPPTTFHEDVYKTRIRWIWSRTPEQVIITQDVGRYILEKANELNKTYDSYIKIFGTEAWKKISRLAIAVAGYLVSTDDTFENLHVEKEHVDFAIKFLISLYDNTTFKFKQFVEMEKRYTEVDDVAVEELQAMYIQAPTVLLYLEQISRTNKGNLQMVTGLDADTFGNIMTKLVRFSFVRLDGYDVNPTEKFRKGMGCIDKRANVLRVGESDA